MSLVFSSGTLFLILSRSLDATRAGAFHLACWCASRALLSSPGRPVLSRTVSFLAGLRLLLRLGGVRLHVQHGLESPAELTGLYDLESGLQNHAQGIAVPMVIAHTAGRHGDQHILEPGDHLCLCANMFEHQERPSRLEHPPDLAQAPFWILYRTEDEGDHYRIELCIGKREGLDRGAGKRDGNGSSLQATPGRGQHGLIRLDCLHAHDAGWIVEREVLASTGAHFQHDSLCLAEDF